MTWGTDPALIIYHHLDQWWVYWNRHAPAKVAYGTDEYVFDTFEDVIKWVENVYPELQEEREVQA